MLVEEATTILAVYEAGRPTLDHKRAAADEVIRLARSTGAVAIIDTLLAMIVFWQLAPRAFMSDEAFKVQLVRRVVRLSPENALTYPGAGRPKKVYRELSPRVTGVLSSWLLSAFGAAGMKMADLERRDQSEEAMRSQELNRGLEDMK